MAHPHEDGPILRKTKELCLTILEQPEFQDVRQQVDAFLADHQAKAQYRTVVEKGQALHQKQHMGMALGDAEVADYESHRQTLIANPLAKGFLDAQEHMQRVQESIGQYVAKTLELGRLPTEEDVSGGSCGSGCGCHH